MKPDGLENEPYIRSTRNSRWRCFCGEPFDDFEDYRFHVKDEHKAD